MSDENRCPQCGKPPAADAPGGLCPGCLLKRGLETQSFATGEPMADYTPPTPDELAPLFPDLEIIEFIGRGGMGIVYKARQKRLDRMVALKILSPTISRDTAFAERFAREAKALAMLSHPHIVAVHDFGQTEGQVGNLSYGDTLYYFLMEYVDGVNLRQLLDDGKLAPEEALAIVPQICDALQYAHDHGVVHRDIKPENVLLDKEGRVKIADFGLAKLIGLVGQSRVGDEKNLPSPSGGGAGGEGGGDHSSAPQLTAAGQVMGTPQYMAPEQVDHPLEVDHRADIYSLGVVFYQMLTGELPVGRFAPPSKKVQIDVRLDEVVLRALEKEPERRYQQAGEIKTRVETIATTPPSTGSSAANRTLRSGFQLVTLSNGTPILDWRGVTNTWAVVFGISMLGGALTWLITGRVLSFAEIAVPCAFMAFIFVFIFVWTTLNQVAAGGRRVVSYWPSVLLSILLASLIMFAAGVGADLLFSYRPSGSEAYPVWAAIVTLMLCGFTYRAFRLSGATSSASVASPNDAEYSEVPPQSTGKASGTFADFLELLSGDPFTSPLARKYANASALGFLGFLGCLGFVPLPGMRWCFVLSGFFGFFGLTGVAFLIEFAARRKAIEKVRRQVRGPAIGLLVTGILNLLSAPLVALSVMVLFARFGSAESTELHVYEGVGSQTGPSDFSILPALALMLAIGLIPMVLSGLMIFTGLKMKRLQAYGLAIAISILAIVSPACLIGLPIGIWALVVLSQRDVRAAFALNRERATGSSGTSSGDTQHPGAPASAKSHASTMGVIALVLAITGPLIGMAVADFNDSLAIVVALGSVVAALILGILAWKSRIGKVAVAIILILPLLSYAMFIFETQRQLNLQGEKSVVDVAKHPSSLEFRILANKQDKIRQNVGGLIEFFQNNPLKTELIDPSGIKLARWVPVKAGEEKTFVNSPDIVQRKSKLGSREITEVLVFTYHHNVTSEYLLQAEADVTPRGRPCIRIRFNNEGALLFGKLTSSFLPDERNNITYRLGIIINGELWSAPRIRNVIFDQCEITGSFTKEQAADIAAALNAGRKPAINLSGPPATDAKPDAMQLTQQGWKLWQQGQMIAAVAKFQKAVELEPKSANAWNGLGWASFNSGKLPEAEKAFQKVISLEPNHPGALNGLGQLFLNQRKYDAAEQYLIKAAPRATAAWWGLARLYLLQGKFDEAEKWARKIVDSGAGGGDARRMLQAVEKQHLDDKLRAIIEPPPSMGGPVGQAVPDTSASSDEPPPQAQPEVRLTDTFQPLDVVQIRVLGTLIDQPIDGFYIVEPDGDVALGPMYGRANINGLNAEKAEEKIVKQLEKVLTNKPAVQVTLARRSNKWHKAVFPKQPYKIGSLDVLRIRVAGTLLDKPIDGTILVEQAGTIPLGPAYGRVRVKGLSIDEAEKAVREQLAKVLGKPEVQITLPGYPAKSPGLEWREVQMPKSPYKIAPGDLLFVDVVGVLPDQPIQGVCLVERAGTIALGPAYGRVEIKGMSLEEAEQAIKKKLKEVVTKPEVSLTLAGWIDGNLSFRRSSGNKGQVRRGPPIARLPKPPRPVQPPANAIGRITGMKDCRWIDPENVTRAGAWITPKSEYALAAGLMEITYNNGAKIILQGPCTYKVESSTGGFLTRGKLTFRYDKKGQKDFPLFSLRTPTAVLSTDDGEYGVKVNQNGDVDCHVFNGTVKMQSEGKDLETVILHPNDSARTKKDEDGDIRVIGDQHSRPTKDAAKDGE